MFFVEVTFNVHILLLRQCLLFMKGEGELRPVIVFGVSIRNWAILERNQLGLYDERSQSMLVLSIMDSDPFVRLT